MKNNMVGWFEIPVTNMDRAKAFYESVFNINIQIHDFGATVMGWFPFDEKKGGAAGSLMKNAAYMPSENKGILIYFSSEDVNNEINRVEAAGGKIVQSKKLIAPNIGYMALFIDSEGNRIALKSRT